MRFSWCVGRDFNRVFHSWLTAPTRSLDWPIHTVHRVSCHVQQTCMHNPTLFFIAAPWVRVDSCEGCQGQARVGNHRLGHCYKGPKLARRGCLGHSTQVKKGG